MGPVALGGCYRGTVQLRERVRQTRAPSRTSGTEGPAAPWPFGIVQHADLVFPVGVPIDEVLDQLRQVAADGSNGARKSVLTQMNITFTYAALEAQLDAARLACHAQAASQWYAGAGAGKALCALPVEQQAARVRTAGLDAQFLAPPDRGLLDQESYWLHHPITAQAVRQVRFASPSPATWTLKLQADLSMGLLR